MKQSTNKVVKCNLQYGAAFILGVPVFKKKPHTKFDFSIEGTILGLIGHMCVPGEGNLVGVFRYKHTHQGKVPLIPMATDTENAIIEDIPMAPPKSLFYQPVVRRCIK